MQKKGDNLQEWGVSIFNLYNILTIKNVMNAWKLHQHKIHYNTDVSISEEPNHDSNRSKAIETKFTLQNIVCTKGLGCSSGYV